MTSPQSLYVLETAQTATGDVHYRDAFAMRGILVSIVGFMLQGSVVMIVTIVGGVTQAYVSAIAHSLG